MPTLRAAYIHVPFCRHRCGYCDFTLVAGRDDLIERYLVALQLTMGARERAHRALRLCRIEENLEEAAERALRRTDDLIARAQEQLSAGAGDAARQSLARAVDLEAQARQDYVGGLFELALRRTQSARAFAYRALRLSGSDGRR